MTMLSAMRRCLCMMTIIHSYLIFTYLFALFLFVHRPFRLNLGTRNALSRKRGFTVVPYANSNSPAQMTLNSKPPPAHINSFAKSGSPVRMLNGRADSDRELNIVPLSSRDDNRRKRREAAMNKSKLGILHKHYVFPLFVFGARLLGFR